MPTTTIGRLAEALVEFPVYRGFQRRLEQGEQHAELAIEAHFLAPDVHFARKPGRWNSIESPCHLYLRSKRSLRSSATFCAATFASLCVKWCFFAIDIVAMPILPRFGEV